MSKVSFGQQLKRCRMAAGLTQEALATCTSYSVGAIRKLEAGLRKPAAQQDILEKFANCLHLEGAQRQRFMKAARQARQTAQHYTTLPILLTSLIGREDDLAVLKKLIQSPQIRLLNLMGSAGVGKTRLALQLAAESTFDDGICFVPLASLQSSKLVPLAIAQTLGIANAGDEELTNTIREFLRDKTTLLILDNFEHLTEAAPLLNDLLLAASELKILATSRTKLHVYGEYEYLVLPLALPQRPYDATLTQSPAVRLLVERASAAKQDFHLTDDNASIIGDICTQLDGLPFAIELAAPYIKILTPEKLLSQLRSRLTLLTDGPRDMPLASKPCVVHWIGVIACWPSRSSACLLRSAFFSMAVRGKLPSPCFRPL